MLQPLLHDETVLLRAPVQAWQARNGTIGGRAIHGLWFGDVRIVAHSSIAIGGRGGEHIATLERSVDTASFVSLLRHLDDGPTADPHVRAVHTRQVTADGVRETIRIESDLDHPLSTTVAVRLEADLASMDAVKSGLPTRRVRIAHDGESATWHDSAGAGAVLLAPGAIATDDGPSLVLTWPVDVPAHGVDVIAWTIAATDERAVVHAAPGPAPWTAPAVEGDDRLRRWVDRALDDLDALRLTADRAPGEQFLAAGSPWFFTLFGRDSIWAARLLLPLGPSIAGSTLRALAALQGTASVPDTAEQPGKIMHELRRDTLEIPGERIALPPLYYGTVDATPLWVCLLHDAWRAGLPDAEVEALLPHLERALAWMRDFGDSDGDGLLEYVDETGHGLSNQGWKDSGDSVQWRDGTLAEGPIALCEVQAYAYEAAVHGADLLDAFDRDGGDEWRDWATRLRSRFHETFWVDDPDGAYPAIALDATKRAVDTVTSNLGHLLGTGLLDEAQSALVAARLLSPALDSGFGLRTLSTDAVGYWPLGYHRGAVWAHDTAIAIRGLVAAGHDATSLATGLLAAATAFDYRMPELYGGDGADEVPRPIPYPASCRPQAWSAAAAIAVWDALR
ncbi:glycogen debranching N-terminal domain-containing protein [Galbitalea sp. SE-J8]|uniref:glycogen debranching N-terminal domain-containing protein n=1 Tax=Galbitalea sp. SE-J8 TaxID=3054952 RepID=UPI00259C78A4|nr:glycogen debranching N-terminal domain-containing protein [Galbitalea sp. SE-J8]MDM4762225.1 glycogen debranching N-terminal domain-containing protein [Galbitalea sp. SE-J8]